MPLAILFALTVVGAGFATLRALGVAKGVLGLGLAPAAGLAVLAVVASWSVLLGAPAPVPAMLVFGLALGGLVVAVAERQSIGLASRTLASEQRVALWTLVAALGVPVIAMGFAFGGAQVPLSPHDGASHTEAIQAYRQGQAWAYWYPPGLAAAFAAWLQGLPWVDSALGALQLGMALPILAALAVFGLGVAVWRNLQMAAAGALLLSFTYVYPYFPEIWSGWPLALSLVLVMGVWAASLEYLERPSARLGVLAGVLLGAMVLVHGSELYSLGVVLPVVLIGGARRVRWRNLPRDIGIASLVALVCAAPYLPTLVHWVGNGGAGYTASVDAGQAAPASPGSSAPGDPFVVFALGALGIDLPLRVLVLTVGIVAAYHMRCGRSVVVVGVVFAAITSSFTLLGVPILRQVYADTYPWGMSYRIFMVVAIAQALLAGAGSVVVVRWLDGFARSRATTWGRRIGRVGRVLIVTWLALATWSMTLFLAYPARLVLGYSADDDAAMGWLRDHAPPGTVVINDGYADAGIWAPYKAGVALLLPRTVTDNDQQDAALVIDNVARLDQVPEAAAVACTKHAMYVYRGSQASEWDTRRFPSLAELRASRSLDEVFRSNAASVFRLRLACDSP